MPKLILFLAVLMLSAKAFSQSDTALASLQQYRDKLSKNIQAKYNDIVTYLDKNKSKAAMDYKTMMVQSQKNWEEYVSHSCKIELELSKDAARGGDDFYRTCYLEKATSRLNELWQQFENIKQELDNK